MADDNKIKGGSKIGETLLGVLGALGSIAGPIITGQNIDFGAPFKMGSAYLQNERMNKDLMTALNSNPHTAGLGEEVQGMLQSGQTLSDVLNPKPQSVPQQYPIQGDMGIGMTSGGMPTNPSLTNEYLQSPEFLQTLAQLRPDLAEPVLKSKMVERPVSPLDTIMKTLALQNYESPSEKRAASLADKEYIMEKMNEQIQTRQMQQKEEASRLSREKWSVGELKSIQDSDAAINNSRFMLDKLNSGINPTVLTALIGKSPAVSRAMMALNPKLADQVQEYRDILKTVMTAVKTQSGVQYGFRELQWIKSSQPNEWDTPEMFKRGITQAMNTQLWNKYGLIIKKAERAGNAEVALREGLTPEQIKAWKVLDKQLAERGTSNKGELNIFSDPKNVTLLNTLGMGLLPQLKTK